MFFRVLAGNCQYIEVYCIVLRTCGWWGVHGDGMAPCAVGLLDRN